MSKIAVYPGTFDPMTNGHVDVVKRATAIFDEVIVAVAPTSRKGSYLSMDERVRLVTEVLHDVKGARVLALETLLVDFVKQHGARVILRGLRAVSDFDYEFQLAHMNHRMAPTIQTLFMPASEGFSYVSGTLVREIVELGGDVSAFVPKAVAQHLQKKRK